MKKNLVIVESPSKAKTIEKILGKNYEVLASYGHVIDLPKSSLGIDIENGFKANYKTIKGKGEILKNLKNKAKKADKVYLASDLDREGEAIAWHISNYVDMHDKTQRIVFNEITESAIKNAIKAPRQIDEKLVDAQQARRLLDRIVGYMISPLLWKSVSKNASAGRVQSVTLKMICDLEDEINNFISQEYSEYFVDLKNGLQLKLNKYKDKKVDKIFDKDFKIEIGDFLTATKVDVKAKSQRPPLVFKTSTLQQSASSYLGFSASKTMRIAQQLYEGLDIAGVTKGLITYMRTDSTRVALDAQNQAKKYIEQNLGKEYVGKYISRNKNAQDAHEGIRPSYVDLEPAKIAKYLNKDQNKLYTLIWNRFITSQIADVKYDQLQISAKSSDFEFSGTVNKITFDGYYKFQKSEDDIKTADLPDIKVNDKLEVEKLIKKDGKTNPPARFSEATIVKKLEAEGIGRPSTYASIIDTLLTREYISIVDKKLVPTILGYSVKNELIENFKNIMDIKFTSNMETKLDDVAEGKVDFQSILEEFYSFLKKDIENYENHIKQFDNLTVYSDVLDSNKKPMLLKKGRYGMYLISESDENEKISLKGIQLSNDEIRSGSVKVNDSLQDLLKKKKGYFTDYEKDGVKYFLKDGRYGMYLESENYETDNLRIALSTEIKNKLKKGQIKVEDDVYLLSDIINKETMQTEKILNEVGKCEKCGKDFTIKKGRFGKFLACSGYPECKNIKNIKKVKNG